MVKFYKVTTDMYRVGAAPESPQYWIVFIISYMILQLSLTNRMLVLTCSTFDNAKHFLYEGLFFLLSRWKFYRVISLKKGLTG